MDYCDAGTLNELLVVDLSESQIAAVVFQVLQGLDYLHKQRRIHRGEFPRLHLQHLTCIYNAHVRLQRVFTE